MQRIACAHENCGTFPIDDALYNKLRRTGETFTCPEGHRQHFKQSNPTVKKLRQEIKSLEKRLDREKKKTNSNYGLFKRTQSDLQRERDRRRHLEAMLMSENNGVIETGPGEFKWSCPCGGRGQKAFESPEVAKAALEEHHRRVECVGSRGLGRVVL